MKKSLLALAVLGAFAGAASAQSSVTIYGQIDMGVSKGNGGTATNQGANGLSEAWRVQNSHASRLGFRGNEDLGGGLSAQFLFEHRFQPDTGVATNSIGGTTGAAFWDGGSYVQLTSAAAGSVYLGRWYTPTFWINLKTDPFGYDGVAMVGIKGWAGFFAPSYAVRGSNTVGYKTPNWGGFTANVATALGEAAVGRDDAFNVEYTSGPIYAGLGYERISGGPASTAAGTGVNGDGSKLTNVAFAYDFKVVRPIFYYAVSKNGLNNSGSNKYAHIALTAPIGPGVLKAVYGKLDPEVTSATPVGAIQTANLKQTKFGIGYDYFLSKRTRLYADLSQGKEDSRTNNTAYNVGVRHDF